MSTREKFEAHTLSDLCEQQAMEIALYREDVERLWSLMPELRNTDAHYDIFEAVHEAMRRAAKEALSLAKLCEQQAQETKQQATAQLNFRLALCAELGADTLLVSDPEILVLIAEKDRKLAEQQAIVSWYMERSDFENAPLLNTTELEAIKAASYKQGVYDTELKQSQVEAVAWEGEHLSYYKTALTDEALIPRPPAPLKEGDLNHEPTSDEQLAAALAKLSPRQWTKEMSDAWHQNIPNLQSAFDALILASELRKTKKSPR